MDPISTAFMAFGAILLITGWIYLMIIAFREDFTWGLCTVLVPPLSYIYSCFAWNKAKEPLVMTIMGLVLLTTGLIV